MPVCTYCDEDKDSDEFHKRARSPNGLKSRCKLCSNALNRKWIKENPEYQMYRSAKMRAKVKSIPFNITKEDIVIPDKCPVLGIPLVRGRGVSNQYSPTLDKIVPSLGYVKGNVEVISMLANQIKSSANPQQLLRVAKYYEE